jgi:Cytosine/adenosine deaminases
MVMNDDERWMRMALAEARKAGDMGEVPIGAVVVCKGIVVGKGHNLTETLGDVTAHAEIQAITAAAQTLGGKYLRECTLYVTVEPCLMCAGAIGWAQVPRIVVGAPDEKRGYSTLVARKPFHPRATVTEGLLAGECMALMQEFFRSRR